MASLTIVSLEGVYTFETNIYCDLFVKNIVNVPSYLPDHAEELFDILLAKNEQDLYGLLHNEPKIIQFIGDIYDSINEGYRSFVKESLNTYYMSNDNVQFILGNTDDIDLGFINFLKETSDVNIDDNAEKVLTQVINMINKAPTGYHKLIVMMHEKIDVFYADNLIKILQ